MDAPPLPIPPLVEIAPAMPASGVADPSFGTGGAAVAPGPYNWEYFSDLAVQADGKVVAVGLGPYFRATRFHADGRVDTSFGESGQTPFPYLGNNSSLTSVAIRPDGRIVVSGRQGNIDNLSGGRNSSNNFFLAQLTSNGALDPSFGVGGMVTTSLRETWLAEAPLSMLLQPNGNIILAGVVAHETAGQVGGDGTDFALLRYLPDGSPDPTFGNAGKVTTDFTFPDAPNSSSGVVDNDAIMDVAVDRNGKIVVAGHTHNGSDAHDFAVLRYNADGSLDASFGAGGKVRTHVRNSELAQAILVLPDGDLLVGGRNNDGAVLIRYNEDGTLDQSFGPEKRGVVEGPSDFWIRDLALRSDGTIVAADELHLRVASFNGDGTFDSTFGTLGLSDTVMPAGFDLSFTHSLELTDQAIWLSGHVGRQFTNSDEAVLVKFLDRASIPEPRLITMLIPLAGALLARRRTAV